MTVTEWLLDGDPAIRWQVRQDLEDQSAELVAAERARVAVEGWGERLLALQESDGQWGGATYMPEWAFTADQFVQPWTSTTYTLLLLRDLGLDPASAAAVRAVDRVAANSRWEHAGQRFFSGEVEPCINGIVLTLGAYFGHGVQGVVDRLLGEQLDDGGWNCEAENGSVRSSFHTTICVLEGLLEHERATGGSVEVTAARLRGQEYLLERGLLRRLSTGEIGDPAWTQFSFPTRWYYDVLRGLDHLRTAGAAPDQRCNEALDLVEQRRTQDGRWPLQNPHPGAVHFQMEEGEGRPSRWNTLRALRVLRWAGRDASTGVAGV